MNKKIFYCSIIVLLIDQISKVLVTNFLALNESVVIIKNFFNITNVTNDGVAFSLLKNQRLLIITISIIAILLIYRYMFTFRKNHKNTIAFALIFGGIIGNLIDRVIFGYVRDFLSFKIINYMYPVFNIADSAICIGTVLLIIAIIRKEDSSNEVRSK